MVVTRITGYFFQLMESIKTLISIENFLRQGW